MTRMTTILALMTAALVITTLRATTTTGGAPSDTAFTYQGDLRQTGAPATGEFQIDVGLWNAESGGNQIGTTQSFVDMPVTDGMLSLELDFGADAFAATGRWLEITVDGAPLAPRQPITRSPFSIQTRGIFVDDALNVSIGTTAPLDQLHIAGDAATLRMEDTTTLGGYALIEDAQPTQLRISKINEAGPVLLDFNPKPTDGTDSALVRFFRETNTTGIKRVEFLRGDFSTSPSARIGVDGEDSFFQIHGGNLGIGTSNPQRKLHVAGDAQVDGVAHFGAQNTTSPFAYGRIDANGTVLSSSANVLSCSVDLAGSMNVIIEGGGQESDIIIATPFSSIGVTTTYLVTLSTQIQFRFYDTVGMQHAERFSFVIFRPQ